MKQFNAHISLEDNTTQRQQQLHLSEDSTDGSSRRHLLCDQIPKTVLRVSPRSVAAIPPCVTRGRRAETSLARQVGAADARRRIPGVRFNNGSARFVGSTVLDQPVVS